MRLLVLTAIFVAAFPLAAETPADTIQRSVELQRAGRLTEAVQLMKDLLNRPGLSPLFNGLALNELGLALHNRNQFEESEMAYRRALLLLENLPSAPPVFLMRARMNLASMYIESGRGREAVPLCDLVSLAALSDTADISQALSLKASLAVIAGDLDKAERIYRETLDFLRRNGTAEHEPQVATTLNNLGTIEFRRERWKQSEAWLAQALEAQRLAAGESHPTLMKVLTNLAFAQMKQSRWNEAGRTLHEALNISRISLGDNHPMTASILDCYAVVLENTGKGKLAKAARNEAALVRSESPSALPTGVTIDVRTLRSFTKSESQDNSETSRSRTVLLPPGSASAQPRRR